MSRPPITDEQLLELRKRAAVGVMVYRAETVVALIDWLLEEREAKRHVNATRRYWETRFKHREGYYRRRFRDTRLALFRERNKAKAIDEENRVLFEQNEVIRERYYSLSLDAGYRQ